MAKINTPVMLMSDNNDAVPVQVGEVFFTALNAWANAPNCCAVTANPTAFVFPPTLRIAGSAGSADTVNSCSRRS